jgi:hypothetical protein
MSEVMRMLTLEVALLLSTDRRRAFLLVGLWAGVHKPIYV